MLPQKHGRNVADATEVLGTTGEPPKKTQKPCSSPSPPTASSPLSELILPEKTLAKPVKVVEFVTGVMNGNNITTPDGSKGSSATGVTSSSQTGLERHLMSPLSGHKHHVDTEAGGIDTEPQSTLPSKIHTSMVGAQQITTPTHEQANNTDPLRRVLRHGPYPAPYTKDDSGRGGHSSRYNLRSSTIESSGCYQSDATTAGFDGQREQDSAGSFPWGASVACQKVLLNTTELLEHVISALPFRDVFRVQRVCKSWRDVIKSSFPIKKHVLLRRQCSTRKPQAWAMEFRRWQVRKGPGCKVNITGLSIKPSHLTEDNVRTLITPFTINPAFLYGSDSAFTTWGNGVSPKLYYLGWSPSIPGHASPDVSCARCRSSSYKHISIWDTYVSDLPHRRAEVNIKFRLYDNSNPLESQFTPSLCRYATLTGITVTAEHGLRLGDIIQAALRLSGREVSLAPENAKSCELEAEVKDLGGVALAKLCTMLEERLGWRWVADPDKSFEIQLLLDGGSGRATSDVEEPMLIPVFPLEAEWKRLTAGEEVILDKIELYSSY